VISSDEYSLVLHTTAGGLQLSGKNLKINKYNQEDGHLSFDGQLDSCKYAALKGGEQKGMLKKLFK
jgi:hypothetical protein